MPVQNIYDTLRKRVERSHGLMEYERQAWGFFQNYQTELKRWQNRIQQTKKATWQELSKGEFDKRIVPASGALPGYFYFFMYNPKYRNTLPYYDAFPLVLVLDKGPNWFFGLNMHYVDYEHRARFFDALYPTTVNAKQSLKAHMKVTYDMLQMTTKSSVARYYRPMLHKYLISHLNTPLLQVGVDTWHLALFLPVEMFRKKTKQYVWKQANKNANLAIPQEESEEESE